MSGGSQTFSLPSPPSPVLLYIGAGYDLSPLLKFAPGGPQYPIVPLSEQGHPRPDPPLISPHVYTSFLFVDAKPRITSSFMVSDFHEWRSLEARVRNVLHYAQGSLSRWRTVPGAPDLLWFEGGGDAALVDSRSHDPSWVFPDPASPPPSGLELSSSPRPLTTLLYLFNTLDVELVHAPLLAPVWPHVEALYVHGLRLHVRTGTGLGLGGHPVLNANMSTAHDSSRAVRGRALAELNDANLQSQLGIGLKRCYVIVGSWGTPLRTSQSTNHKGSRAQRTEDDPGPNTSMGIRHVDFVSEAWRKWKAEARRSAEVVGRRQCLSNPRSCLPSSISPPSIISSPSLLSTPGSLIRSSLAINTTLHLQTHVPPVSPLIFRRPRARHYVLTHQGRQHRGRHPDVWDSDYDGDSEDVYTDTDGSESEGGGGVAESTLSPRMSGPFHVRIPQLAWSSTLRGGCGGYFVEKTVEESIALWRAREGRCAGESEEDETATEPESNSEEAGKRDEVIQKKQSPQYLYNFRSFFGIFAQSSSTSPARVLPVNRRSVTSRSRMPPPRSRPRLRPRPPTPAPDFEETESENSASETVFGASHCGGDAAGEVCECECQRLRQSGVTNQMGMRSETESVASGFWRRRSRARRSLTDFNACTAICGTITRTKSKAKSMSQMDRDVLHLPVPATLPAIDTKSARTTNHVASRHRRDLSSKSLDALPNIPKGPSGFPPQIKSRERRINIADFLSTTSDPDTCDAVRCLSSVDALVPTSISDAGPVRFSSDTACDSFAVGTAPAISNLYPIQLTSTSTSFPPAPLSPASSSTTFPRSPYCPSDLFDNSDLEQDSRVRSGKKWRPLTLPFWAKTKQQGATEYRAGPISGLSGWKIPMAHNHNASPPSRPPSSPHKPPCFPHKARKAHKDACIRAHSHDRARTTHRFRFDPDAPPVPPLPSHFRGHAHTRSMFDPPVHRETNSHAHTHTPTSSNPLSFDSPSLPAIDRILGQSINTPPRQSEESDQTRIGV